MNNNEREYAVESYFYWNGDWIKNFWKICSETVKHNFSDAGRCIDPTGWKFPWVLFKLLFGLIVAVLAIACTFVFLPLLFIPFLVFFLLAFTLYTVVAMELNVFERIYLSLFGLKTICPRCSEHIKLPYYGCPNSCHNPGTGKRHLQKRLIPTMRYGAFYRVCGNEQCKEHLPTSRFFGRNALPAFCPNCNEPLDDKSQSVIPMTLALIGGPKSGKTMITMDIAELLLRPTFSAVQGSGRDEVSFGGLSTRWGWHVNLPDKFHQEVKRWHDSFVHGHNIMSTQVREYTEAVCVDVKSSGWGYGKRLFIYDPPGESFEEVARLVKYDYYKHLRGAIFVIDPFSIPGIVNSFRARNLWTPELEASRCSVMPEDSLDRWLISMERDHKGISKKASCAIIINKTDIAGFSDVSGLRVGASEQDCLAFMEKYDLGNFTSKVADNFRSYRYFSVSANGIRNSNQPYAPQGLDEVIGWLLKGKTFE